MFRGSRLFISQSAMWFGTNSCGPSSMPISSIGRLRLPHESNLDRQSLANRMFDFLKRGQLIRRGLASRKTRRRRARNELLQSLEYAPYVKLFIFVGFIAGLAFLIFSGQQAEPTKNFVIALLFLAIAMTQLWINQPRTFSQNSRVLLVFGTIDAPLLVTSLISGFTAVYLTLQVRRRSKLIRAGVGVGCAIWLLSLTFGLIGPINLFSPIANDWGMIGLQSALAVGNGIVTAMVVGGALPMLEHLFRITTDISWLEASDLNHPLLRRMTIEAPGTYHHSLVVANLAEAAAEAIGANATLCRVCSYFHDVGKLVKPE